MLEFVDEPPVASRPGRANPIREEIEEIKPQLMRRHGTWARIRDNADPREAARWRAMNQRIPHVRVKTRLTHKPGDPTYEIYVRYNEAPE